MRRIELSNESGELCENAYMRMMSHVYFPESEVDREQGLLLYRAEMKRFQEVGENVYRPSEVFKALINILKGRMGQIHTCGCVAIAMCELDGQGKEMSLNTAAKMVSEMNGEYRKMDWVSYWDGEPIVQSKKTISSDRDVKEAFRVYKSVAHICCAMASLSEHLSPRHPLDRAPDVEGCIIATALFYQKKLQKAPRASHWDMWDLATNFPQDLQSFPPLLPSRTLIDLMFEPYNQLVAARQR